MLTVIFILELAAGITGFILKNSTSDLVLGALKPTMQSYGKEDKKHITVGWDQIHTNFRCCGLASYEDWIDAVNGIPLSCCEIPNGILDSFSCKPANKNETETETQTKSYMFEVGCVKTFGDFIQTHASSLAIVGIVLAVIQLFGLLFACVIARRIKKNRTY